jgi:uncharacterized membrane protein
VPEVNSTKGKAHAMDLTELMHSEELHIQKLDQLVKESLAEEKMLSLQLLEMEREVKPSFHQQIADGIANFGGSWKFIISFLGFMFVWISFNVNQALNHPFDPYPFILLNLILSCIAALQAPIIMMSQNRKEEKDRLRSRSDYMINLKAELEVRGIHRKIDLLITEEMKTLFLIQEKQMEMLTEIQSQLAQIKDRIT